MAPGESPGSLLRSAARDYLGVDSDPALSEILKRMRDEEFYSEPATLDAILVLSNRPIPAESNLAIEAAHSEKQRLDAAVNRFSASFFDTPIEERWTAWRALVVECKDHLGPSSRLRFLSQGLDVPRGSLGDDSSLVGRLAAFSLAVFPLCGAPRAAAFRQFRRELQADTTVQKADLRRALKQVRRQHPEVAALAPELERRLLENRKVRRSHRQERKPWFQLQFNSGTGERSQVSVVVIALIVGANLLRLFGQYERSTRPPQSIINQVVPPFAPRIGLPPPQKPDPRNAFLHAFRRQFLAPIRSALGELKKPVTDDELRGIVEALPVEDAGIAMGTNDKVLTDYWTDARRSQYTTALKGALARAGVMVDAAGLDSIGRRLFAADPKVPDRSEWADPSNGSETIYSPGS